VIGSLMVVRCRVVTARYDRRVEVFATRIRLPSDGGARLSFVRALAVTVRGSAPGTAGLTCR